MDDNKQRFLSYISKGYDVQAACRLIGRDVDIGHYNRWLDDEDFVTQFERCYRRENVKRRRRLRALWYEGYTK